MTDSVTVQENCNSSSGSSLSGDGFYMLDIETAEHQMVSAFSS